MKKSLLSIALFVFALSSLSAQTKFGVKSGLNNLKLKSYETGVFGTTYESNTFNPLQDLAGITGNPGFYLELFAEYPLSERLSIQPEVSLNFGSVSYSIETRKHKYTLNQLNIPILATYRIGKRFKIFAGPSMNFILDYPESGAWDVKNFSWGMTYGASFDITKKLSMELSFNSGLQNIIRPSSVDYYQKGRISNAQIGLSYSF